MIVKNVSTEVYGLEAIIETADELRAICAVEVKVPQDNHSIDVLFKTSKSEASLEHCVDAFMELVLKNSIRKRVRDRTRSIRDLIVRQAFAEGEFAESDGDQ